MNFSNPFVAQNEASLSYQPMPFFDDVKQPQYDYNKKLDLNLYCIQRPQQTCFIRVTNPNMLAWGIEAGDMLIVEQNNSLAAGELVVLQQQDEFHIYEFVTKTNGEYVFLALDSKMGKLKISNWQELPIVGTVTNVIHKLKRKPQMKLAA